jgi:hypothetical protein
MRNKMRKFDELVESILVESISKNDIPKIWKGVKKMGFTKEVDKNTFINPNDIDYEGVTISSGDGSNEEEMYFAVDSKIGQSNDILWLDNYRNADAVINKIKLISKV